MTPSSSCRIGCLLLLYLSSLGVCQTVLLIRLFTDEQPALDVVFNAHALAPLGCIFRGHILGEGDLFRKASLPDDP